MYLDIYLVMSNPLQPQSRISFIGACVSVLIILLISGFGIALLAWQQDKNDNKNSSIVRILT
jgi:hypothetical protein